MMDITALLMLIAKQVRKRLGEKSLNELIAMGIAVYEEITAALPKTRMMHHTTADPEIVAAVLEELAHAE